MFLIKNRNVVVLLLMILLDIVRSGVIEGDIAVRPSSSSTSSSDIRNSVFNTRKTWDYGKVPFIFDPSISREADKDLIRKVTRNLMKTANCLKFEEITDTSSTSSFIKFTNDGDQHYDGNGCWSYVGEQGGEQVINLDPGCMHEGKVTHEIFHALGFAHEQNRPDRDEFVNINWDNIKPRKEGNFEKAKTEHGFAEYMSYDFQSIMHYGSNAFGRKGKKTIEPKNGYVGDVGSKGKMTGTDMMALNTLYNCETVSSQVILQFMKEENARVNSQLKQLKTKPRNSGDGLCHLFQTGRYCKTNDKSQWRIVDFVGGSDYELERIRSDKWNCVLCCKEEGSELCHCHKETTRCQRELARYG